MTILTFFAAISQDGFLAGPDGDMAWAEKYLGTDEDYGFAELMFSSNAALMGSRTFDFELEALGDQQRMLPTFVLTNNPMKYDGLTDPNVHLVHGDISDVVAELKTVVKGKIFVVGGADVVNQLVTANLLDELTLFFSPDVLGAGLALFNEPLEQVLSGFAVTHTRDFESGLSQRTYSRLN